MTNLTTIATTTSTYLVGWDGMGMGGAGGDFTFEGVEKCRLVLGRSLLGAY